MMKKLIFLVFSLLMLLTLTACGDISEVQLSIEPSALYSDTEISAAMDTILTEFRRDWNGCALTELAYAGDGACADHQDWAVRHSADDVLVLTSAFTVDSSGGDGSLNPNSTYKNWKWILVRSGDGRWNHVDHGYG